MRSSTRIGLHLLLVAGGLLAAGCANKNLVDYSTIKPQLNYSGRRAVAVAVHDQRARVTSGEAEPAAVGETRSIGGKQAHLTTKSLRPLAAITADAIAEALRDKGFDATIVKLSPSTGRDEAEQKLLAGKPDYGFLLTLNEWWSAMHKESALQWDLVLDVYDAEGQRIAQSSNAGEQQYDEDGEPIVEQAEKPSDWGDPAAAAPAPAPEPEPEPAPEPTAPPEQPPAADPDAFGDPDAFDTGKPEDEKPAAEEPAEEAESDGSEAAEEEPEPEPEPEREDPHVLVLQHVVAMLEVKLTEVLSNPDIPRQMKRFDTEKLTPKAGPLTPQDGPLVDDVSEGSYGEPPAPPPPE